MGENGDVDLWAPVSLDGLPAPVLDAHSRRDWPRLRTELQKVVDALSTDGPYGRALLSLIRSLPPKLDPTLDRYRAAVAIDFGDWDVVEESLAGIERASELRGLREIILAPVNFASVPRGVPADMSILFEPCEFELSRWDGNYLRWARRAQLFDVNQRLGRSDVAISRHLRYRALHHSTTSAIGEALAGSLDNAIAFAIAAQDVAEPGEPLVDVSHDIEELARFARGELPNPRKLRFLSRVKQANGTSPWGTWECLYGLLPLMSRVDDGTFESAVRLASVIAVRMSSPRAQLQARSWLLAAELLGRRNTRAVRLQALLADSRSAAPGLRALPEFLHGVWRHREASFATAERLARGTRSVWLQVAALSWLVAIAPTPESTRRLARLLVATGWRRAALVPQDVAAEAALALAAAGHLSEAVVRFVAASGKPSAIVAVCRTHLETAEEPAALAAAATLAGVRTSAARALLLTNARRSDAVGRACRRAMKSEAALVSEREAEVLELAGEGLTNKQIAERLFLSEHTIARHLQNARNKLGAANRLEAVRRLEALSEEEDGASG